MKKLLSSIAVAALSLTVVNQAQATDDCDNYPDWDTTIGYEGGEVIAHNGVLYECEAFPFNGFCGNVGFEPGTDFGDIAWTEIGICEGDDPDCTCEDVASCDSWSPGSYESGALVYDDDTNAIYSCNEWPYKDWCGIEAYRPGSDFPSAEAPYWEQAWTEVEVCADDDT